MQKTDFTRINNDVNGNPRYVCHFFNLLSETELNSSLSLTDLYKLACKRANKIGGRKYRGKAYGGGIVFQSYEISRDVELINNL